MQSWKQPRNTRASIPPSARGIDWLYSVQPGDICLHRNFYVDQDTGEFRDKFLVALARLPGGDIVFRLLTSRQHGRPEVPPCYHGDPYPGFYLGVPGGPLERRTWVDLRGIEDYDGASAATEETRGNLMRVMTLDPGLFRSVLDCVAAANDTTRQQERASRDHMSRVR